MGGHGSGRGGISREEVLRAERLITAGWRTGQIARELDVERSTIQRIRRGDHFLQQPDAQQKFVRCACGAMADENPCKVCQVRNRRNPSVRDPRDNPIYVSPLSRRRPPNCESEKAAL
jgi:hypothetical protein